MHLELNSNNSGLVTIHYDGVNIVEHHMDLDAFINSLEGFRSLFKLVATELGVEDEINLEILPLEKGSLIVTLSCFIGGSVFATLANNFGNRIIDDLKIYERIGFHKIMEYINRFLDKKKSVSDYKKIDQLTAGLDSVNNRIMLNKDIHNAASQFVSALSNSADSITMSSTGSQTVETITKKDLSKFQNPFIDIDANECVYEEEKVLRLDGIRYSTSEWVFYEKDEKGSWNKAKEFRATVLDDFLLSFGRNNSLSMLRDKDLYCTIRCKEITRPGNRKKTIERYVIRCKLEQNKLF